MFKRVLAAAVVVLAMGVSAQASETPSAKGATVYFVNLSDGATVSSPFKVVFGLSGMGIAPAGTEKEHTGHHHLFINRPPLGKGPDGNDEFENPIPSDENHVHFGKGQTEGTIELAPGKHTLQLVLGDHFHAPHNPPVTSEVITITVK